MNQFSFRLTVSGLAIAAGTMMLGLSSAHAQAPTSSEGAVSEPSGFDDIVVVARRSEENLQSVPLSVTAVSSEQLESRTVTTGTDLQKLVPTLSVGVSIFGSAQQYSLRGVRTGVVTYFNEVPVATNAVDLQLWDLQSVQALSGPQGTLFGRNSTGGAVLFVPQRPDDEFGGYVEGRLGAYFVREVTGVVNLPVSDKIKVRLGVRRTKRDGIVENISGPDLDSQNRTVARASVLIEPTDWLSNYTVGIYSHRDERPFAQISDTEGAIAPCPINRPACAYGAAYGRELTAQQGRGIRSVSIPLDTVQFNEPWMITNILTANTGPVTLKYIAGYSGGKARQLTSQLSIPLPVIVGENSSKARSTTHELQALGDTFGERLNWVAGLYYSRSKIDSKNSYLIFALPGTTLTDLTTQQSGGLDRHTSKAAYAQGTLAVTDALNVTVGARYTKDKQLTNQRGFSPGLICNLPPFPNVDRVACRQLITSTSDAWTYNLALDYQVSEAVLAYVTTRKGYNAGGFNPNLNNPELEIVNPEFITDYEAGLKTDWRLGDVPIRANVSVFLAKYKDIQRSTSLIINDLAFTGNFNAAKATLYGSQIEFLVRPAPGFDLQGSYGYLHTKYDSFENAYVGNLADNRFAQAPKHTAQISGTYTHKLDVGEIVANASYAYISSVTFADDNLTTPGNTGPGYGLVDARLDWRNIGDAGISLGVYVKNATDKTYVLNATDRTTPFGFISRMYGDPRTYGVELRYDF